MSQTIKRLAKQLPVVTRIYETLNGVFHHRSNKKILTQLASSPDPRGVKIAGALESINRPLPRPDREWIERIESERERHLGNEDPLDDGTLEKAGLYDAGVTIGQACAVSKPAKPALVLFLLTRALRPTRVIELGTNVGISSAYIGAALKLNGPDGELTTLDASPYRQRLARENHRNVGVDNVTYVEGLFEHTLVSSLTPMGPIDLAFIDGHHQYQPTMDYFEEILKVASADAVFVFDDIRWSEGMKRAWSEIQSDARLGLIVDLSSVGVAARRDLESPQGFVSNPLNIL